MSAIISLTEYKINYLKDMVGNTRIVELIDSQSPGYDRHDPYSLIGSNMFTYLRVPVIQTITDAHILIEVDRTRIQKNNPTFFLYTTTMMVLCHQDRMDIATETGNRTDLIAEELQKMFFGAMKYGFGELELARDVAGIHNHVYQFRELTFECSDLRKPVGPHGRGWQK